MMILGMMKKSRKPVSYILKNIRTREDPLELRYEIASFLSIEEETLGWQSRLLIHTFNQLKEDLR